MNKETIMNTYAKEQGYEDWNDLMNEFVMRHMDNKNCEESFRWINSHIKAVTDLIQEELKKKVSLIALDTLELFDSEYEILSKAILNTEIL